MTGRFLVEGRSGEEHVARGESALLELKRRSSDRRLKERGRVFCSV